MVASGAARTPAQDEPQRPPERDSLLLPAVEAAAALANPVFRMNSLPAPDLTHTRLEVSALDHATVGDNDWVSAFMGSRRDVKDGPALSAQGLSKRFGDRVAFADVSFEIGCGEVFGFLGPNGAGKTTTVRTLGTLLAPTAGSATVAGIALTPENGVEIRRRIAIMPETPGLWLKLSVLENLECFADLYEVPDPGERIDRALRAVDLADRARDACGTLSKGLRHRVALARALLSDPEVLFLDEPTAGLDPVATRDVHELIAALGRSGVTIFLTTHRLEEAERLCDRVAILNTTLQTVGRPDELRDRLFAKTLTVRTVDPLPEPDHVFGGLAAVDGWRRDGSAGYVLAVSDPAVAAPAVTRALVAAGADVLTIAESHRSLEDVYLELIGEDREAQLR
jgi:ABC-2 type transport system ATP-binding protein